VGELPTKVFTLNGVGILMLETRASRTWFNDSGHRSSFLGDHQTDLVNQALQEGGVLADVDTLVVCSPVPLAFLSPSTTISLKKTVEDFKGLWGAFEDDLAGLISVLHDWKCVRPNRELVVTAGDVHLAAHTDIFKAGEFFCAQLTSSAIHNERLGFMAMKVVESASAGRNTLCANGNWQFEHRCLVENNNYGLVQVSVDQAANESRIGLASVVGQGSNRPTKLIEYENQASAAPKSPGLSRQGTIHRTEADGDDHETSVPLSHEHLRGAMDSQKYNHKLDSVVGAMDLDGDGTVTLDEMLQFFQVLTREPNVTASDLEKDHGQFHELVGKEVGFIRRVLAEAELPEALLDTYLSNRA